MQDSASRFETGGSTASAEHCKYRQVKLSKTFLKPVLPFFNSRFAAVTLVVMLTLVCSSLAFGKQSKREAMPTNASEAKDVLLEFFRGAYTSCTFALEMKSEVLVNECFHHHWFPYIGQPPANCKDCGSMKSFVSIDETGYVFRWAEVSITTQTWTAAGTRYGRGIYSIGKHEETVHVNFADVAQIEAKGHSVKLLSDTGSTLDSFHFESRKRGQPVLTAFRILSKNLK